MLIAVERLQVILEAKDRATPVVRQAAAYFRALEVRLRAFGGIVAVFRRLAAAVDALGRTLGNALPRAARATFSLFRGGLSVVIGMVRSAIGAVFDLARAFGGMLRSAIQRVIALAQTAGKVVLGGLAASFALVTRAGIRWNLSLRDNQTALTSILGSAAMARDLIGRIFADSRASAFGTDEMLTWARQLAAFGFAAERIPRMLRTIQDTARGLGGGTDLVSRMVLAFAFVAESVVLQVLCAMMAFGGLGTWAVANFAQWWHHG